MSKPANIALKDRGVELRPLDLKGSQESLVSALKDIEILISAIEASQQLEQLPLANAVKLAGIKRFIPCGFITIIPPGGIQELRDGKEQVYNHVKQLGIPYTILDVGWWYQIALPRLPSGKIDYAIAMPDLHLAGDGNQLSAHTDLRDIGRYVAKVIVDERTLNKMVFVYNELWSQNQIWDALEKVSGAKVPREYDNLETLRSAIANARVQIDSDPADRFAQIQLVSSEYKISWGIRGDNTPEYAKYLGYLTSKELYPDMNFVSFSDYIQEVLDGKAKPVYEHMRAGLAEALKK